jgi:hypothetical protein
LTSWRTAAVTRMVFSLSPKVSAEWQA